MDRLNELIAENLKDIRKGKGLSLDHNQQKYVKSAGKGRSESYDIDGV